MSYLSNQDYMISRVTSLEDAHVWYPESYDFEGVQAIPLRDQRADTKATLLSQDSSPTRQLTGVRWALVIIALVAANLLSSLDNTIVADLQVPLIADLGEVEKFPWISIGFGLGAASTNLLTGQLHKLFDKKIIFLLVVLLFGLGSVICGSARSLDALIVGRVICGIGGTGIFMSTVTIVTHLSLPAERALYLSFPAAAWALGAIIGPIIGGAINDSGGWRWCFYLNLIYGAVWMPIYIFLLPSIPTSLTSPFLVRLRRVDFLGFVLWSAALCCFVTATAFGGGFFAWQSGSTISLYVVAGVLWICFCAQQKFNILTTEDDRFFPVRLLRSLDMWILFAQMAAGASVFFLTIYFIPLYFQFIKDYSALQAGVQIVPFLCITVVTLIMNSAVMGRTGLYMPWYAVGSAIVVLGAGLMYTIGIDSPAAAMNGYSMIVGIGLGCYTQASFSVAQAKVPPADVPTAVSFISCAQILSWAVSFAIGYSAFMNTATNQITLSLPGTSRSDIQAAIRGVGSPIFKTLKDDTQRQVLLAINKSIQNAWIQVAASGALSFVLAMRMKWERVTIKK